MNIREYYTRVNTSCQAIFEETVLDSSGLGRVHHVSSCLYEFSENLTDADEINLLRSVSSQIESSSLSLCLGLYRQAFSSLRLALELGLGTVYFSLYKLEHREWLQGMGDIKWSKLICEENGVISSRLAAAYFNDLKEYAKEYNLKASTVYRKLSEFVHGNYETWKRSGIVLKKNDELITKYFTYVESVKEVLLFSLCCRYMKQMTQVQFDSMQFLIEDLGHVEPIRLMLGGPKEA